MMGLDSLGPLMILLALALMTVCPLHVTIARSKVKSAPITALVEDRDDDASSDARAVLALGADADEELAADQMIAAIAETYDQA